MADSSFHWADWVLFAAILLLSVGIGVWTAVTGGKQKTINEVNMYIVILLQMYYSLTNVILNYFSKRTRLL